MKNKKLLINVFILLSYLYSYFVFHSWFKHEFYPKTYIKCGIVKSKNVFSSRKDYQLFAEIVFDNGEVDVIRLNEKDFITHKEKDRICITLNDPNQFFEFGNNFLGKLNAVLSVLFLSLFFIITGCYLTKFAFKIFN